MGFLDIAFVRQHPLPVRRARAGRVGSHYFGERPADGLGRPPVAQVLGDVAVGGDRPGRPAGAFFIQPSQLYNF